MEQVTERKVRTERLKSKAQFARVFRRGRRLSSRHVTMLYLTYPQARGPYQLGVSASSHVGTSVRRNRIKRLLREAWRTQLPAPTGSGAVILIGRPQPNTPEGALPEFAAVRKELAGLLWRAGLVDGIEASADAGASVNAGTLANAGTLVNGESSVNEEAKCDG